jgi:hypothetical protein
MEHARLQRTPLDRLNDSSFYEHRFLGYKQSLTYTLKPGARLSFRLKA